MIIDMWVTWCGDKRSHDIPYVPRTWVFRVGLNTYEMSTVIK